ncbi:MAG: sugar phosphate isomerase/epimerase family protein [Pirellulales bacterium]
MSKRVESASPSEHHPNTPGLGRRELLAYSAAFGTAFLARQGLLPRAEAQEQPASAERPQRRYDMKKSINLWGFPYPDRMSLAQCFELAKDAGFDGVEINFNLEGEFSAESSPESIREIGALARKTGLDISGVCSFLYWPYSLTHNDPERRKRGLELGMQMIEAARLLETENLLVVPGAVYAPWLEDYEPVPNDVCDRRAKEAVRQMIPVAQKAGVHLNMENIFANAYLFSPQEMVDFVDSFDSPNVHIHFDTGNIMQYQFPEHWIPILGKRIKNIHFKEWDKRTHEFNLATFRTLLDGTTNWPAVIEALDKIGYRGYLTFEYFHPHQHYPEALVYQTADALDRMLGIKG